MFVSWIRDASSKSWDLEIFLMHRIEKCKYLNEEVIIKCSMINIIHFNSSLSYDVVWTVVLQFKAFVITAAIYWQPHTTDFFVILSTIPKLFLQIWWRIIWVAHSFSVLLRSHFFPFESMLIWLESLACYQLNNTAEKSFRKKNHL